MAHWVMLFLDIQVIQVIMVITNRLLVEMRYEK